MRGLATFSWDTMFVFPPYAPKSEMCKMTELTQEECRKSELRDVDEGEFLLVFMRAGRISRVESFPRTLADFDESSRCAYTSIDRNKAAFKVVRQPRVLLVCE